MAKMTKEQYQEKQKERSEGIAFLENREMKPLRDLVGETVEIVDYHTMRTKNGDAYVFIIAEDLAHYYFANSILFDMFENIDDMKCKIKVCAKPQGKRYYPIEFA